METFYFCEQAEASVQKSHDLIMEKIDTGFYDQLGIELPQEMVPVVVDDETGWRDHFKPEQLDLIVSNMGLHWVNDIEGTFKAFSDTLEADGALISTSYGGDTL